MGKIRFTLTADMTVGDFKKQIEEQLGCIAKIYPGNEITPYEDDVLLGSFASYLKGGEAAERYAEKCECQEDLNKIVDQIVLEYDQTTNISDFMEGRKEGEYFANSLYSEDRYNNTEIYLWKKDEPHCFHPNDTFVVVRKLCGKA